MRKKRGPKKTKKKSMIGGFHWRFNGGIQNG